MTPKTLALLVEIERVSRKYSRALRTATRDLKNATADLPLVVDQLHPMLVDSQQINDRLQQTARDQLNRIESSKILMEPTPAEEIRLLSLNRQLKTVTRHLRTVLDAIQPGLEAKLADPVDPMCDYEIEAVVSYYAHEDDPEVTNDDALLLEAEYPLKSSVQWEEVEYPYLPLPTGLLVEPHCALFQDLYSKCHGDRFQNLSFRDCLRINEIFVDVQVSYQYVFSSVRDSSNSAVRID